MGDSERVTGLEDPAFAKLRDAYGSGDLVVFAGAGVSAGAGLPSWKRLVELLIDHARDQGAPAERLEEMQYLVGRGGFIDALTVAHDLLGGPKFRAFIARHLDDQNAAIPPAAKAIAALKPRLRAILTTNLDGLLEKALGEKWPPLWKATSDIAQRRGFIFKLHGTLRDPSSWVFTRPQYDRTLGALSQLTDALFTFFHAYPLLFVGYGLVDDDFDLLLSRVRARARGRPPQHFALVPQGGMPGFLRQRVERAGIRLIEYPNPDGTHSELVRVLEALSAGAAPASPPPPPGAEATPSDVPPPDPTPPRGQRERRRSSSRKSSKQAARAANERCPYPGLEYFDESMADLFRGRDTEVAEACQFLGNTPSSRRWLQVEGASGAGKSSFARAGIVPKARLGWLPAAPAQWHVAVLRPGPLPLVSLADAVFKALGSPPSRTLDGFLSSLRSSDTALASFLREHAAPGHGVLLVVDQLEEALLAPDAKVLRRFDAVLANALRDKSGPLYLVTTVRSDFLGGFGKLPELELLLNSEASRFYLKPLSSSGLLAAIREPAEHVGLRWEKKLPEKLVEDVEKIDAGLPLLAHTLQRLWHARVDGTLTHAAYNTMEGIGSALAKSADALLKALGKEGRERARRLFLALTTHQGGKPSRRSVSHAHALEVLGGDEQAPHILAQLSGARPPGLPAHVPAPPRLVVVSQPGSGDRVDLVHEALLSQWETLRKWSEEERKELDRRDELESVARAWERSGSPTKGVVTGEQLAYFRRARSVSALAAKYLQVANAHERRGKWLRRGGVAVLVAGLVVMSVVAAYALNQRALAEQRLVEALTLAQEVVAIIDTKLGEKGAASSVRKELLDRASRLLNNLGAGGKDSVGARLLEAGAFDQRGSVALAQGKLDDARSFFQTSLDINKKLAGAYPSNAGLRRNVAVLLERLGDVAKDQGKLDDAHSLFQESLAIHEKLSAEDSSNTRLRRSVASGLERLGDIAKDQGKLDDARSFFQRSHGYRKKLYDGDASDAFLRRELAVNFMKLGEVAQAQGKLDETHALFKTAHDHLQASSSADADNASLRRDLACSLRSLGSATGDLGKLDEARPLLEKSRDMFQDLVDADRSDAILRHHLSVSLDHLGDVAKEQGKLDDARSFFQQSLDISRVLAKNNPSDFSVRRSLSIAFVKLGEVAAIQKKPDDARSFFGESLDIIQGLAEAAPSNVELQHDHVSTRIRMANYALVTGDQVDAHLHYLKATAILDQLARKGRANAARFERQRFILQIIQRNLNMTGAQPALLPAGR